MVSQTPSSAAAAAPPPVPSAAAAAAHQMTAPERRSSVGLAAIFALRMLGLFLVLPVFVLEAQKYSGGDNPALVGLAMGMYGLTQAVMQLPLGMASDRFGRKRVILVGLVVFALGSLVAALATSVLGLLLGRALQGAGAVSAAVTALLADQTRESVRTKAMAMVGMSIGLMFAVALVLAPWLTARVGLAGLFGLTFALTLGGIALLIWGVPPETPRPSDAPQGRLSQVWQHGDLRRLNLGVFALHTIQMAMWVSVPTLLVQSGLAKAVHWQVYLPALVLSVLAMGALFGMERRGRLRAALLLSIGLIVAVQVVLAVLVVSGAAPSLWSLGIVLFVFFCGFNMLEATQPSLVSRMAAPALRGAALGAYNTLQSLGLFAGGALGGAMAQWAGAGGLFVATAVLGSLWLLITWPLQPVGRAHAAPSSP